MSDFSYEDLRKYRREVRVQNIQAWVWGVLGAGAFGYALKYGDTLTAWFSGVVAFCAIGLKCLCAYRTRLLDRLEYLLDRRNER